jgi:hypothetical protein
VCQDPARRAGTNADDFAPDLDTAMRDWAEVLAGDLAPASQAGAALKHHATPKTPAGDERGKSELAPDQSAARSVISMVDQRMFARAILRLAIALGRTQKRTSSRRELTSHLK